MSDATEPAPLSAATHPVIAGFYPDPTVCRVGDDYYLANSSFEYFPGAPLFHSRDLVRWEQVGSVLDRRDQFVEGQSRASAGIYGSTLRHHDGRFWFVTTNANDFDAGQLIVHSDDPAGPWSDPVFVSGAVGIDPDLAWDDDGTCYLTWKALQFGVGEFGILQASLDLTSGQLLESPYPVWQGTGLGAAEGPHLYHVDQYWYLLLAEGGTERGHAVTVARGSSPRGPFEASPDNPVFTHRSTVHSVQNVGHADLVSRPDGAWAAVYLGVRPHGSTPGFHVLGRETFLAGVTWDAGWPAFHEDSSPVPTADHSFTDDFSSEGLHHRWVSPAREPDHIATRNEDGGITITGPDSNRSSMLCTRIRDLEWQANVLTQDRGEAILRIDYRHWYGLSWTDGTVSAIARIGDIEHTVATSKTTGTTLTLTIESVPSPHLPVPLGHAGPDDIRLSFCADGNTVVLAQLDGRYLSTEVASGFTGRMLGITSAGGQATYRSVSYRSRNTETRA
ncbi:MAG: glycoside hydrolase family 43 [Frondihabitans sp.]|nr:glycoside hydrolase family 43 [Frondihabitans sp.]